MKPIVLLLSISLLSACPKGTPVEQQPTTESDADLFTTVERWQQSDAGKPHIAMTIERVVYVGDAYDVVLADASVDSGGEAVILRVVGRDGAWRVDTINKGPADYLWPSN